jgi:hypothetical protein
MSELPSEPCFVFVDDSIHDEDGFVLTAAVVTYDDLAPAIAKLLIKAGLTPGIDEYKSHSPKAGDERSQLLRSQLCELLSDTRSRIAVAVTPRADRETAGTDMLSLLARLKSQGALGPSEPRVWLDEGLLTKTATNWLSKHPAHGLLVQPERNSRDVLGLQLADLAAHTTATMIRCELGSIRKMVPAGPDSGYDPEELFPLEAELWARLRFSLAGKPMFPDAHEITELAMCAAFGLRINERCSQPVKDAAEKQLGAIYLGCIH